MHSSAGPAKLLERCGLVPFLDLRQQGVAYETFALSGSRPRPGTASQVAEPIAQIPLRPFRPYPPSGNRTSQLFSLPMNHFAGWPVQWETDDGDRHAHNQLL